MAKSNRYDWEAASGKEIDQPEIKVKIGIFISKECLETGSIDLRSLGILAHDAAINAALSKYPNLLKLRACNEYLDPGLQEACLHDFSP